MRLGGQVLEIKISYLEGGFSSRSEISIGGEKYEMTSLGSDRFEGRRVVRENRTHVVDKSVVIHTREDVVKALSETIREVFKVYRLANADEIKYEKGDNAFVFISNNIEGTLIGNFAALNPTKPRAADESSAENGARSGVSLSPAAADGEKLGEMSKKFRAALAKIANYHEEKLVKKAPWTNAELVNLKNELDYLIGLPDNEIPKKTLGYLEGCSISFRDSLRLLPKKNAQEAANSAEKLRAKVSAIL
jgi:hypothetical protein